MTTRKLVRRLEEASRRALYLAEDIKHDPFRTRAQQEHDSRVWFDRAASLERQAEALRGR